MDDDTRVDSFFTSYFFIITFFNQFAFIQRRSNIKDTEKSIITSALGNFTKKNEIIIFGTTLIIIVYSIVGIFKLEVENSFINYFDKETEIYKGMKKIDDELGGTTPLNVILKFPIKLNENSIENDEFDEWEEDNGKEEDKAKYCSLQMDKILVHDYLEKWIKFLK